MEMQGGENWQGSGEADGGTSSPLCQNSCEPLKCCYRAPPSHRKTVNQKEKSLWSCHGNQLTHAMATKATTVQFVSSSSSVMQNLVNTFDWDREIYVT